jgi:hypothetical protein
VRLMPAKDVKAYVKRNKNDAADAEAICEAVRRPTMRFVQIKSVEQQGQARHEFCLLSLPFCNPKRPSFVQRRGNRPKKRAVITTQLPNHNTT